MKVIVLISLSLLLVGCANPMTRLLPKLEKLEPPAELMEPPKQLKILVKPEAKVEESEDVAPQ